MDVKKRLFLLFLSLFSLPLFFWEAQAGTKDMPVFILIVKSSPGAQYESRLAMAEKNGAKLWGKVWGEAIPSSNADPSAPPPPAGDLYMEVRYSGGSRLFSFLEDGRLRELSTGAIAELPEPVRSVWLEQAERLRRKHYGELIRWEEAKQAIPLKRVVTVVDLETGYAFRAQRRAGSNHADMQPLTRADTAVMKHIYGGKWSWKRRAVLVLADGRKIAASMHGMPHGGDGIPDNGFSGHFCIHFLGSTTHKAGAEDTAHQYMVHRAAGKTESFIAESDPERLAELFFESLHQQDRQLLYRLLADAPQDRVREYEQWMDHLDSVRPEKRKKKEDYGDSAEAELRLKAALYARGGGVRESVFQVKCVRDLAKGRWKIADVARDGQ
jgi:hypothetical protein